MQFVKDGDIYKVARITGVQDNILGVTFADQATEVELVALQIDESKKIRTKPDDLLAQVSEGLAEVNAELGKIYFLSKVFYAPNESSENFVYKMLIKELVRRTYAEEAT
ncbi:hypothetical protein [Xanthomonas oryzae]|uniref:hypothetical protein n=1 Tax=Xanthomonas oryzae TaxID=347 RepID=UPI0010347098|nr:hypothetical protein [Xanthomonas oryzae]QBG97582.1 hypothetical protein EYC55_22410 [Xanthomonas oryzae]QBH01557.1 hypothetical protein EYC56_22845 [Xanthomonas oryzae]